jgi:Transglutaminase-like superfamily
LSRLLTTPHRIFRAAWWSVNLLLLVTATSLLYAGGWEYSVRRYLKGFSEAIVPAVSTPEQKVESILEWMQNGPPRPMAIDPAALSARDPETTLNYQQLLSVCGTATNAFLNLARSSGLTTRRLLLLTPDRITKHVVAEVLIGDRWIIADPTYRTIMKDKNGYSLTRKDMQDPVIFSEATGAIPNYPSAYTYERFAHVRVARLPLEGLGLRRALDYVYPTWEESLDWSLLLERESYFVLAVSAALTLFFFLLRLGLGWYADRRLRIPRFHLREHVLRAGAAFFSAPEIK